MPFLKQINRDSAICTKQQIFHHHCNRTLGTNKESLYDITLSRNNILLSIKNYLHFIINALKFFRKILFFPLKIYYQFKDLTIVPPLCL